VTEVAVSAPRSLSGKRLALVAVVVLCCVGLLGWWATTRPADAGPLALPGNNSSESGGPVLPGQWMVTSIATAPLSGSAPAIVESVQPTDPSQASGLVLRYAVLTDTPRGLPGAIRGWPPLRYQLAGLHGHIVQPGNELWLAVGATSRRIGSWRIDAFDVTYAVAGYQYTTTFRQGITLRTTPTCPSYCRSDHQLDGRIAP
jgi:hypothetical protein